MMKRTPGASVVFHILTTLIRKGFFGGRLGVRAPTLMMASQSVGPW